MRQNQGISRPMPITAIFLDALNAGGAVTALLGAGFPDTDVDAIGVLEGRAPDLREFLESQGIPHVDAVYYNNCFQDGGILLIIRTPTACAERNVLEVVLRHGGILPPSCELRTAAVH